MKKIFFTGFILILMAITVQATEITTGFPTSASSSVMGNMFDVTVFGPDLLVTGFDIHTSGDVHGTVNLYTRSGTYVGHETSDDGWYLLNTVPLEFESKGVGNATPINIDPFTLTIGVTGFYVVLFADTYPDTFLRSTVGETGTTGDIVTSNDNLAIHVGIGILPGISEGNLLPSIPFADTNRTNYLARTWHGTIEYNEIEPPTVPEPTSILLLGTGLLGLASVRRRFKK